MTPRSATDLVEARPGEIFAELRAVCEHEVIRFSELEDDLARVGHRPGAAACNRADAFQALGYVLATVVTTKGKANFKDITEAARVAFRESAARRRPDASPANIKGPDQPG